MDDETLLRTLKNGVMIAGHEMGPVGEHWPAIHAISNGLDKEFFKMQTYEAVVGELEFRYASILNQYEEVAEKSSPEDKKIIMEFVKQKWDEYYAILEPIDKKHTPKAEDLIIEGVSDYSNMAAAAQILRNMGGKL